MHQWRRGGIICGEVRAVFVEERRSIYRKSIYLYRRGEEMDEEKEAHLERKGICV